MTKYLYPERSQWADIVKRPTFDNSQLRDLVSDLLTQIREGGDLILKALEEKFDHARLTDLCVSGAECLLEILREREPLKVLKLKL